MNIPIYAQYVLYALCLATFIWAFIKFSLLRSMVIALANIIFGVVLILNLEPSSPGLIVTLTIGFVLIALGLWGFILWIKQNFNQFNDQVGQTETLESWWQTVRAFDMILIIGLFLRFFVIQPFYIEGPSMNTTFQDKEIILVDKVSYRFREPIRGEVVIFIAPVNNKDDYIKRVIGLPGDTVVVERGKVYVNGKEIVEPYLSASGKTPENAARVETKVGIDEYFVLGDNRPQSSDSREWGLVPQRNLIGRAVVAIWPFDKAELIKAPSINTK